MVEVIPLQLDRQIERNTQWWTAMRHLPRHAMQPAAASILKVKPKMLLLEHLARRPQHDATHRKHRLGIALTKRMQRIQFIHQPLGDLLRRKPDRNLKARLGDIAARMRYGSKSLADSAKAVVQTVLPEDCGGVIAIDRQGNIVMEFNTPGMSRAAGDSKGRYDILLGKDN